MCKHEKTIYHHRPKSNMALVTLNVWGNATRTTKMHKSKREEIS
jgi:hypothetical protein